MRPLFLAAPLLVLLTACDATRSVDPSPNALASLAVIGLNERIPISFVGNNPCPPVAEQIAFDGLLHISAQSRTVPSAAGKVHVNLQSIHGVGLTSGLKYAGMATGNAEADITFPPFVLDAQVPVRARIVSQGFDPNAAIDLLISLHREPDGNILVINVLSLDIACRG